MKVSSRAANLSVLAVLVVTTLLAVCVDASLAQGDTSKTVVIEPYTERKGRLRLLRHRVDGKVVPLGRDGLAIAVRAIVGGTGNIRLLIKAEPQAQVSPTSQTFGMLANHGLMREIHWRIREMALDVAGMDDPVKVGWTPRRRSKLPTVRLRTAPDSQRAPQLRPVQVSPDADFKRIDVIVPMVTGDDEYRVRGKPRLPRTLAWVRRLGKGTPVVVDASGEVPTRVRLLVAATVMGLLADAGAVPTLPGVHDWKLAGRSTRTPVPHEGRRRESGEADSLTWARRTKRAVESGLGWLARAQKEAGSWAGPQAAHEVGVTSLALMAFLGQGVTPSEGSEDQRHVVSRGIQWLKSRQRDGVFVASMGPPQQAYDQVIATIAVVEAAIYTRSEELKTLAQSGLDACASMVAGGAVGYAGRKHEPALAGWMAELAYRARHADLRVSPKLSEAVQDTIIRLTDSETGRVGYETRGGPPARYREASAGTPSEPVTASGVFARIFTGTPRSELAKSASVLAACPPTWSKDRSPDLHYLYFGTYAMFQVGLPKWPIWNEQMRRVVVENQVAAGENAGSWDPVGPWGRVGGRVYSTALMALTLQVYYRYARKGMMEDPRVLRYRAAERKIKAAVIAGEISREDAEKRLIELRKKIFE